MNETFLITLPSDSSMEKYPNNVMANFTTEINPSLRLEDNWDVALREITIPRIEYGKKDELPVDLGKVEIIKAAVFNNGVKQTSEKQTLILLTKADIKTDVIDYVNKLISDAAAKFTDKLTVTIKKITNDFKYHYYVDLPVNYSIKFFEGIAEYLGFTKGREYFHNEKAALLEIDYTSTLFVYCDIIIYSHVGDSCTQLLNTVHVQSLDEVQNIKFDVPDYIPLSRNVIESIKITIKDSMNNLVSFKSGTNKVITKLVFRKKYGF
jgi:hypothetical protein